MKRRLELSGPPPRFWEIAIHERSADVRWGAIGGLVQRVERHFELAVDAHRFAEAEIAKQLASRR